MKRKVNPTVIGAFVLGGIGIIITLTLLLGSDVFFKKEVKVIMYFDGSVTGLNVGAPVKFRGVKIGAVTDIKLVLDRVENKTVVPVIAAIDRNSYLVKLSKNETVKASELNLDTKNFVKIGLRAQLKVKSLLTGQLFIELDFDQESPFTLQGDGGINEIPTKATTIQKIAQTLDKYPVREVLNNLASTMESLDKILSDPIIIETIKSVNETSKGFDSLAKDLNKVANSLSVEMSETLKVANGTLKAAESTFRKIDIATASAEKTLKSSDQLLGEDSEVIVSLKEALTELTEAARSVRNLADALEQQPESILHGKSNGNN